MITILTILFTTTSFSTNLSEEKSLTPKDKKIWSQSSSTKEKSKSNNFKRGSNKSSREACKDCYIKLPEKKSKPIIEDYKKSSISYNDLDKNSYDYDLALADTFKTKVDVQREKEMVAFSDRGGSALKIKSYSKKISIQVGAFRRYAGAKVYAKKYDLLSDKYKVEIDTGAKDQKPLYRVRIEGFASKSEAKNFKRKYSLTGAFLVMK
jgi:uncharacterized linocin/CFP29 family protein